MFPFPLTAMPSLKSWIEVDPKSHFSIHNIPFGIISTPANSQPRAAIAIGDYVLDLHAFAQGNGFAQLSTIQPHQAVFSQSTLNAFAALGRPMHKVVREYLQSVLLADGPFPEVLEKNKPLREAALFRRVDCTMHLPMAVGDYTDFYAGIHHATNVGTMFRGADNALQPNYTHLPVGYHGRTSSIVVSGTPIRRPRGQILPDPKAAVKEPILSPCRRLDFELELGCFICKSTELGDSVDIADAPSYLFGLVLLNDWSARDIQSWEYVPLGPFNSKNFASTISPWVVLMDALEPFAAPGIPNDTTLLPYLTPLAAVPAAHYAIDLRVSLSSSQSSGKPTQIAATSATNLLFSFPQMLAHHTVGGCNIRVGDMLGSGTISGPKEGEQGALLELTLNGSKPVSIANGESRTFLEDGDTLTLEGVCGSEDGALVGFGECVGTILPCP